MKPAKSLLDVIQSITCLGELEGAEGQIKLDGRMVAEVQAAIARRRAELMRQNSKK